MCIDHIIIIIFVINWMAIEEVHDLVANFNV
jgi:hypothetical protein